MGYNISILSEGCGLPGLDHGHAFNLELEECIHFHLEDLRIVLTKQEFLAIADAFSKGEKFFRELGSPEISEKHYTLAGCRLEGKRLQSDRLAVELTRDGTVHVHNKCLRIHMTQADFWIFADVLEESKYTLMRENITRIKIDDPKITIPSPVKEYLVMLENYTGGASPLDVKELSMQIRWYLSHPKGDKTTEADLQRPLGSLPPDWRYGSIPEELNRKYLYSLYESIKTWGYAKGPFFGEYMQAYRNSDNTIYLKGSHRVACLKKLNINEIDVFLTEPATDK